MTHDEQLNSIATDHRISQARDPIELSHNNVGCKAPGNPKHTGVRPERVEWESPRKIRTRDQETTSPNMCTDASQEQTNAARDFVH